MLNYIPWESGSEQMAGTSRNGILGVPRGILVIVRATNSKSVYFLNWWQVCSFCKVRLNINEILIRGVIRELFNASKANGWA